MPELWYTTLGGTNCIAASEKMGDFLGEQDLVSDNHAWTSEPSDSWVSGFLKQLKLLGHRFCIKLGRLKGKCQLGSLALKRDRESCTFGRMREIGLCSTCCVIFSKVLLILLPILHDPIRWVFFCIATRCMHIANVSPSAGCVQYCYVWL